MGRSEDSDENSTDETKRKYSKEVDEEHAFSRSKKEEIKTKVKQFIENELQVKVKTERVTKLGERTYLMQMESAADKSKVMQNKSKLKGREGDKVFINDDLSKQDRDIQKIIRTRAQQERKDGKRIKIGFRKLYLRDEEWKWDKNEQRLILTKGNKAQKN
ncbi:hypothetical protein QE152_g36799 [Popillia japonica]|uniref:Uncharacterized protein n=1 Tax=Popillia japonica TaxID=7064 RepID=A0AAW1ICJ7_POPJA